MTNDVSFHRATTDETGTGPTVAELPLLADDSREKPVVVTGAAGLVGSHTCQLLVENGWRVRAIVRHASKAVARLGHLKLEIREGDIREMASMRIALNGAGSLVHLAAIAIEKEGESYSDTNTRATKTIVEAALAEGVERMVYMSQNGADSQSPFPFLRSKGKAEDIVTASALQWTVLRPSVIFGPEDEFVNVLARLIRLSPLVYPVPGGGTALFQPIAVDNVANAIAVCLQRSSAIGQRYAIGGPAALSLRQMVERILVAMGTSRKIVGIPIPAVRPVVACAQRLLPHPPVTTGLLDLLSMDNVIPNNDLINELNISPVPFAPEELLYLRKIGFSSALRSLFSS